MLTNPKWQNWQTAAELRRVSKMAKELDDLTNRIWRNASPAALKRIEGTAIEATDTSALWKYAALVADELQAEADASVEAAE